MKSSKLSNLAVLVTFPLLCGPLLAQPTFQIYSPDYIYAGDYGPDQFAWFVIDCSFELWAIGAYHTNTDALTNVRLLISVPDGENGTITITGLDPAVDPSFLGKYSTTSFFPSGVNFNYHYPLEGDVSDFRLYDISPFFNVGDPIFDYNADGGTITPTGTTGQVKKYLVTVSGYTWVHFDMYGLEVSCFDDNCKYSWELNPGSHCITHVCHDSISLKRFEINQCFQDVNDDGTTQVYELIETKPFVVRMNLDKSCPGSTTANVKLGVFNTTSGQQIGTTKQQSTIIRHGSSEPIDFLFNDDPTKDMKAGWYDFRFVVEDPSGAKLLESSLSYEFKSSKTVRMLVVPKVYIPFFGIGDWNDTYIKFVEKVFPIPKTTATDVNYFEIVRPPVVYIFSYESIPVGIPLDIVLGLQMNEWLKEYKNNYPSAPADFICAVVPKGFLGERPGFKLIKAVVIEEGLTQKYPLGILAHEIGHIYGLGEEYVISYGQDLFSGLWILDQGFEFDHNPPPLKKTDDDPLFIIAGHRPHGGETYNWADDRESFAPTQETATKIICDGRYICEGGYDIETESAVDFNTIAMMGKALYENWISGPEYRTLIDCLVKDICNGTGTKMSSVVVAALSSGQTRMIINGIVDINDRTAEVRPLIPAPNSELTPEVSEPNCHIAFVSSSGGELGTFRFLPLRSTMPESGLQAPFWVVVDLPVNTARIQVVINETIATELQLTDNSPTVQVLSPNGGEKITGEMLISWSGSDPDSNDLSYTVEFSSDGGTEWSMLTMDYPKNELVVDANYLVGGSNCLVKVIASDGWNTSEDISDAAFSITTKPPEVSILEPADESILLYFASMQGRCVAYDPETGYIKDPNVIVWASDIDGFLGKGKLIGFELSLGDHVLSVTVTDPEGKSTTGTVEVTVVANRSDFNNDLVVNITDLAEFIAYWLESCSEPQWCEGCDLDHSRHVNFIDFAMFANSWLWKKILADLDFDYDVDFVDYSILANQWQQPPTFPSADIAPHIRDHIVDFWDLSELAEHWLEETSP